MFTFIGYVVVLALVVYGSIAFYNHMRSKSTPWEKESDCECFDDAADPFEFIDDEVDEEWDREPTLEDIEWWAQASEDIVSEVKKPRKPRTSVKKTTKKTTKKSTKKIAKKTTKKPVKKTAKKVTK